MSRERGNGRREWRDKKKRKSGIREGEKSAIF